MLLTSPLRARLYFCQIRPAILEGLVVETVQVVSLVEDSHGEHRANARSRLQMGVGIIVNLLGARLVAMLVKTKN